MKESFTMIELIFVIVILGILAAVAIPKLSVTRDDAKVTNIVTQISSVQTEIVEYAISQAKVDSNMSKMSQTLRVMESEGKADVGDKNATFLVKNFKCVDMNISSDDVNLSINFRDPKNNSVCKGVQRALAQTTTQMIIKGARVTY